MATSSNRLKKGINQDIHPAEQSEHSYRGALNIVPISEDGNIYSISNEDGTIDIDRVTLPLGKKVIGKTVLNNDIILVLADSAGNSQVGYIREDSSNLHPDYGIYHPIAPYNPDGLTIQEQYPEDNSEFNFTMDYPVDCVARKIIDGSRILYYTDNNNPFGRINLDNPPEVGEIANQAQLVFDQRVPTVKLDKIVEEVSGDIPPGSYQFITRYVTQNGGTTTFGIPSDLISIVPTIKKDGVDNYSGEYPSYGNTNKNIALTISNIDLNYQELEIIVAYYSEAGVFQSQIAGTVPITSDTVNYTFTDISNGEERPITREELRQVPISYKKAKAIEQKDNTLFLSNLRGETIDDSYLQKVANNITVSYEIEELPYSGREGNVTFSEGLSYTAFIESDNKIKVEFGTPIKSFTFETGVNRIDTATGNPVYGSEDQVLSKEGEPAVAVIDVSLAVDTDTLTLEGETFTASTTPTTALEFDVADPISSLITVINSVDRSYYAEPYNDGADKIKFIWKGIGGEGAVITATGGIVVPASFTGEVAVVTSYDCTGMEPSGNSAIIYTFAGATKISLADELYSNVIYSLTDAAYTVNAFPILDSVDGDEVNAPTSNKSFSDFVDEKVAHEKRGYRRGEVYSLGFMLLFKDGTTSFVYHIPGNDKGINSLGKTYPSVGTYNIGETTGLLGTYLSEETYPLDQNYPGIPTEPGDDPISSVRNVRHHVMPRLDQEPHFRQTNGNNAVIRTMGLKFELNPLFDIPDDLKEKVEEIVFVREMRNSNLNRSVHTQGLVNRLVESADHFNNAGFVSNESKDVDDIPNKYHLQEMPFFNNLEQINTFGGEDTPGGGSGNTERGIAYPGGVGTTTASLSAGERLNTAIRSDRGFLHTPESILNSPSVNLSDLNKGDLKPVLKLNGDAVTTSSRGARYKYNAGKDYCADFGYHYMHGNYTSYDVSYAYSSAGDRLIDGIVKRDAGVRRNNPLEPETGRIKPTNTRWTQGGWEFKLDDSLIDSGGTKYRLYHRPSYPFQSYPCFELSGCNGEHFSGYVGTAGTSNLQSSLKSSAISNHLYNVETNNTTQYGQLTVGSYIPCGRFKLDGTTYEGVYSGDTYVTKFSFNTGSLICNYPLKRDKSQGINKPTDTQPAPANSYFQPGGEPESGGKADGYDLRACHYFFVESNINTNYRHRPENETRQNYFPNEPSTSRNLDNFWAYAGNIQAYNDLYSYENNLKEYYSRGSTQTVVTDFENRTIYSEQAFEDSVVDSYRNFLVRNYYDLPAHTGPIWDTFIHANTLYMHTPKSCWRTFAEPAATLQGGNLSEVILGTGTLFARPSHEVSTSEGGYAGTISQYGGVHTQIGYLFPDVLQGKIFVLAIGQGGPHLKDLSLQGLYTFCHKNMKTGILGNGEIDLKNVTTLNSHLIDNPFNDIGFTGGYDFKLRRAWLIKKGTVAPFCISYSALMDNWSSFHSYYPESILSFDNRTLFIKTDDTDTSKLWEMNIGDKGKYFDKVYDSELEISVPTGENQTFNNQSFHADVRDNTNRKLKDDFFKTIQVYTDRQNTNILALKNGNGFAPTKLDGEVFYKFRNDEFRLSVPRDSVKDNNLDIFNLDNIYEGLGGNAVKDAGYPIRPRIKGDYAIFKYVYSNGENDISKDNSFVLREIRTIFENNIR